MRNTHTEDIAQHSYQVALIAHALANIEKHIFLNDINTEKVAVMALYHDCSEVITGDLPTPIKYFNDDISKVYKDIEKDAVTRLLNQLPKELSNALSGYMTIEENYLEGEIVKSADKLSAYIKCVEEELCGNYEFSGAKMSILKSLNNSDKRYINYFLDNFIQPFYMNLDELSDEF